jgi:cytochrome c556
MKLGKAAGLLGALFLAGVVGVTAIAWADNSTDPIKNRRDHMKLNGASAKIIGGFLDGSVAFDAAKASAETKSIADVGHEFSVEFDEYFTEASKTGDTKASPTILDNKDDFKAKAAALEADATAAMKAAASGADSFKAAAGKMFGNCKGCHEKYKVQ